MTTSKPSHRRRITGATVLAAAGATAVGLLGAAAPANADVHNDLYINQYASIAYSPVARASGASSLETTLQQAWDDAMTKCKDAGGVDCTIMVTAENSCVALANNFRGDWGVDTNANIDRAAFDAKHKIFGGVTQAMACAHGGNQG